MNLSYSHVHLHRISLVPFRTFKGPLFSKPVTGQKLFLAVSYSKLALAFSLTLQRLFDVKTLLKKKNLNCDKLDTLVSQNV